jgi:predicted transcriptional regulator
MDEKKLGRLRSLMEVLSRVVEANAGASAPAIRKRANLSRATGYAVLGLLEKGGFVERRHANADVTFRSVRPYRVSNEAPQATFGATHATGQGGA